jgi:hypothetical protein
MSRVFLAEETRLARRVVVKVLPPELAAEIGVDRAPNWRVSLGRNERASC